MNELIEAKWYEQLVEDCKIIITETIFNSRWALVEGYHQLGKRILEDEDKFTKAGYLTDEMSSLVTTSLQTSQRTIERAIQFAKKYPELDKVPEGKNISWHKICNKYLPTSKENKLEIPLLPPGKFAVIYADPPWPVESMVLDKWESPLDDKYETMTLEEIKILNIPSLAAEDCSLFLWTTHTFLREAFDVITAWGFKYHCCITWDKGSGWSLCGFHRMTEFCLYAYKGKINVSQSGEFIPTLIKENKRKHSQKPEKMYELIESHTPGPRIELFARKERDGWKTWGKQI